MAPKIFPPFNFHCQVKPAPVVAFSVTEPPVQNVVLPLAVIVAVGATTVTVIVPEILLPQELVIKQEYTPAVPAA